MDRYTRLQMKLLPFTTLCTLCACSTFATPAELESAQILAVQSEPASLGLGESASLSLLAADADGPLVDPQVQWSLVEEPGLPVYGELTRSESEVRFVAPSQVPSLPTAVTVQAQIEHEEGPLVAVKVMLIGGPSLVNPSITGISAKGAQIDDGIVLQRDEEVEISVELTPPPSKDATYAWYARPGTIDAYRSNPTTLVASPKTADGWLYVVVRDHGGIAYKVVPLSVE